MKKIFSPILLLLLINTQGLRAQLRSDSLPSLSHTALSADYLKRAKSQKTIGFVLLGSGVTLMLIGIGVGVSKMKFNINLYGTPEPAPPSSDPGLGLFITGGVVTVSSIPLFLASAKNKRKARLTVNHQTTFITPTLHLKQIAVGLAFPFGR